jgi:hypothetical protein
MTKAKPRKSPVALHAPRKVVTNPPVSGGRRKPSEAETLPPPELTEDVSTRGTVGRSRRVKKGPGAATIDEVTADLSKDPRHED